MVLPIKFFDSFIPLTDLALSLHNKGDDRTGTVCKMEALMADLMSWMKVGKKADQLCETAQEVTLQLKYLRGALVKKDSSEIDDLVQTVERTVWHLLIPVRKYLNTCPDIKNKNAVMREIANLNENSATKLVCKLYCNLNFGVPEENRFRMKTLLQTYIANVETEQAILAIKLGADPSMTYPLFTAHPAQSERDQILPPLFQACIKYADVYRFPVEEDKLLRMDVVRTLLLAGAKVDDCRDDTGELYLGKLMEYGRYIPSEKRLFKITCKLLKQLTGNNDFIHTLNREGRSLLYVACKIKSYRTVDFLIRQRIHVRQIDIETMRTPAHGAEPPLRIRMNWENANKLETVRAAQIKSVDDYLLTLDAIKGLAVPLLTMVREYYFD